MLKRVALLLAVIAAMAVAGPPATAADHGAPGAEAAHEGGSHGGTADAAKALNPLEPFDAAKRDLALWTAVIFVLLLIVLGKYAWGPIADGLTKRENKIHEDLAAAERSNTEAKRLLDDYQQKLLAAGDEVRQMIEAARRDAEKAGAEIVDKARQAAQGERDRALAEIDLATQSAMKELADRSAGLAVDLAGRIIGARLDRAAHKRLIEQALADFQKVPAGRRGPGVN